MKANSQQKGFLTFVADKEYHICAVNSTGIAIIYKVLLYNRADRIP